MEDGAKHVTVLSETLAEPEGTALLVTKSARRPGRGVGGGGIGGWSCSCCVLTSTRERGLDKNRRAIGVGAHESYRAGREECVESGSRQRLSRG